MKDGTPLRGLRSSVVLALMKAGIRTAEGVREASDEALREILGGDDAAVAELRGATKEG